MAAPPRQATPSQAPAQAHEPQPDDRRVALARYLPFAILALWTLLVTLLLARLSVDSHHVFRDESNAVLLGRLIEQDLAQAVNGTVARGPERLTSWVAGVAALLSDVPTRQYELLHLANALFQGLIVVPLWLAARELALGRWAALVPALIASAGSFASYGIFTLNTTVGLLCATFMLWALLRALRRPGLLSDVLVVVTLGMTVLGRIGWAPVVAALVPAVLATAWLRRPAGEGLGAWLRALPLRLLRRHPLLVPVGGAIVVAALVVGPGVLLGGEMYGGVRLTPTWDVDLLWNNTRILFAHLALGTAVVPFVLAVPVFLRGLVRPVDAVEGGFAWLLLGYLVLFSYAYYASMNEDRYFAVLAAPIVLAGALAYFRKPPPPWSVLASGAGVTWLVATSYEWPVGDVYAYFIAPTSRFFMDVVLGKLSLALPFDDRELLAFVAVSVGTVAALLVALVARGRLRGRPGLAVAGAVLAGMLAFQLASMDHPARKFTQVLGMESYGERELQFIDTAVAGGDSQPVAFGASEPLSVDGAVDLDLNAQLPFLQVFNASLGFGFLVVRDFGVALPPVPAEATVDWRTGAIRGGEQTPEVLLSLNGRETIGFDAEPLQASGVFPWARLQRLDTPLRASWMLRGELPDRYAAQGQPMQLRVFPEHAGTCVEGTILQHPHTDRSVGYRLTGGVRVLRGVVKPTKPVPFTVRVPSRRPTTFTLRGQAGRLADGQWRAPTLVDVNVRACDQR